MGVCLFSWLTCALPQKDKTNETSPCLTHSLTSPCLIIVLTSSLFNLMKGFPERKSIFNFSPPQPPILFYPMHYYVYHYSNTYKY